MDSNGFINPMDNPEAANAAIAEALKPTTSTLPTIEPPGLTYVKLPGGLLMDDGRVLKDVEVQELNGAHEERLVRAQMAGSIDRVIAALLECGVVKIGGEPVNSKLLKRMLIGDREAIILGIRQATYGDSIEFEDMICPHCKETFSVTITLDEIPIKELNSVETDALFTVPLRKGRSAQVRLATGDIQEELLSHLELTTAEQNTILLSRTVLAIIEPDGRELDVQLNKSLIRDGLSIPDRAKLIREVTDRQPGPRYKDVVFAHDTCGKEVNLPIDLGTLFRDL